MLVVEERGDETLEPCALGGFRRAAISIVVIGEAEPEAVRRAQVEAARDAGASWEQTGESLCVSWQYYSSAVRSKLVANVEATTRDVDDDYLVALAREHSPEFIVTGDKDLLEWEDQTPPVITPAAFKSCLVANAGESRCSTGALVTVIRRHTRTGEVSSSPPPTRIAPM